MKDFQLIKYIKTALLSFNIYASQIKPGNLFLIWKNPLQNPDFPSAPLTSSNLV